MTFRPYRYSSGTKFPPSGFGFVYHGDFPERYVREKGPRGWDHCDVCAKQYKLWVTNYQNWELLPELVREAHLCTRCFRKIASGEFIPHAK